MELRVLRYFLVIAEEGNMTQASARLHVGQPTLSRQMKDLERELGQKLFERRSHGMALTDAGRLLLDHAAQMAEIADRVEDDFAAMRNKPLGDVRIGGAETDQLRKLAGAMRAAHAAHPDMAFHYTSGNLDDIAFRLDRGLIDFAVLSQPANLDKYETLSLPEGERWMLYMLPDNPLAKKRKVARSDLAGEPLIISAQVAGRRVAGNNVAQWFGDDFARLNVVATFNLSYVGSRMVQEGMGSMLTWDGLAGSADGEGLVTRPLDPPLTSWLAIAWSKGRPLSPAAAFLLDVLRRELGEADEA